MVIEELFTRLGFQVDPKGIDKAKNALSGFKKWVGGLALGAGFVYLAKTGLDAAMSMESLTAQFTTMTGSAERANSVIQEISEFAAKTPFTKMGLADAGKTLMAFGLQSEKVVPTLKMLGDVAGADQNKLNSLALVFGQIQSTGRLMGQDLLQLINQGFNPLTEISKQTGISMGDLKKLMEQGAISADMVTAAFRSATSEGGLFFGNLEAQSQTLQGRISTLKDNFVTALQNMAEAFMPLLKAGVDMLVAFDWSPIVNTIKSVANALKNLPLGSVFDWIRRLSVAVILFATRDLDRTLILSLKKALASGVATFKGLQFSFTSFKNIAITGIKSIGLAMKTALGPIGIALMAIEGFIEAYNWLKGKTEREASEDQLRQARGVFKNAATAGGQLKTREQVVTDAEKRLEQNKQRVAELQTIAGRGGREGAAASKELEELSEEMKGQESWVNTLKQVYTELTGLEWSSRPWEWGIKDPGLGEGIDFSVFDELEKTLKEGTAATKKQTKATEENTRAQKKFDITALSRQAFDAAFNVKLREITLGAI